eukprot:1184649-Pyramimonas_sp.AAC.1
MPGAVCYDTQCLACLTAQCHAMPCHSAIQSSSPCYALPCYAMHRASLGIVILLDVRPFE